MKLPHSYDIIGSKEKAVAIIEIPEELKSKEKEIANQMMKEHKSVKTVLKKISERKGKLRTRNYKLIKGDKNTEVTHIEHGYSLKLDPQKVYFSQRELTERQRIASLVKPDESVLVMFSGVAPFAVAISKKQPKVKEIYAVELNKEAHKYARKNIKLNRCFNIKAFEGDVNRILPILNKINIGIKTSIRRKALKNKIIKGVRLVELYLRTEDLYSKKIENAIKKFSHINFMLHTPIDDKNEHGVSLYKKENLKIYEKLYLLCEKFDNVLGIISHPLTKKDEGYSKDLNAKNKIIENIETLRKKCKYLNDYLFIENINVKSFLTPSVFMKEISKKTGIKNLCLDIAHYAAYNNQKMLVKEIKSLVKEYRVFFHIGDNLLQGKDDFPKIIGKGNINFKEIIDYLDFGVIETYSKDENLGKEMTEDYYKLISMIKKPKKFDRIIMPLPKQAYKFLDLAFTYIKDNGIIHFYYWSSEPDLFSDAEKLVEDTAKKLNKKIKIINKKKVLPYGPKKWKVVLDILVS